MALVHGVWKLGQVPFLRRRPFRVQEEPWQALPPKRFHRHSASHFQRRPRHRGPAQAHFLDVLPQRTIPRGIPDFRQHWVSHQSRFGYAAPFRISGVLPSDYLSPKERLRAWNTQRPSDSCFRLADRCRLLPSAHYLPHPALLANEGFPRGCSAIVRSCL